MTLRRASLAHAPGLKPAREFRVRARYREETMRDRWSGWIGFAGWMMVIIGSIDAFEGLIAIIRGHYYVLTPQQIIVFDTTTWGWVTLIWGIVVALAGVGLLSGSGWARWTAIVVASVSMIGQLGFMGSTPYPLWGLTVLSLTVVVLYALIVRWNEAVSSG
jgi:hypothetical protein